MLNKIVEIFSTFKMTVFAGISLAVSLVFMLGKIPIPVDPAWISVIVCGFPIVFVAVYRLIFLRKISTPFLISTAMIASIAIGEIFAAGEVAFIMAIGELLEEKTIDRAKKGISSLIKLVPKKARKILADEAREEMLEIELVKSGDILRVLPGEAIPVDGIILAGNTSVDQSIISGESLPIDKTVGDSVFCGTINRFGVIEIKTTKIGEDSSLQKLIRLIQEAESNKAPMQRIIDKWANWLVPIAFFIAVAVYFLTLDVVRGVTILVVFCPCALVLATPTAIMAAIAQAAKHGVIIKSGAALEKMGKVDCITFDKTGTLTQGKLTVSDVVSFIQELSEDELLEIAASAESHSEHPLGKAIVSYAKKQDLKIHDIKDFRMIPGKGISAYVYDKCILAGTSKYLMEEDVQIDEKMLEILNKFCRQGKGIILVSSENVCIGIVALSDALRDTTKTVIENLKKMKVEVIILTGDHEQTAKYLANQIGVETVYADLLPAKKVEMIEKFKQENLIVCMVGDGVNDAPALKTADVGIAMGAMGSDIAIDAADIALMGDDISKVPYLKHLSNSTLKTIKFNIAMSMCINFTGITLSVLGILGPVTGAFVHNIGSILVVLNAARLYERKYL